MDFLDIQADCKGNGKIVKGSVIFLDDKEHEDEPDRNGGTNASSVSLDEYKRLAADFENYRKQAEKRMAQAQEAGEMDLACDLLAVLDDLDSAQAHYAQNAEVLEGVAGIAKKLAEVLQAHGLEGMASSVGKKFDPAVHEAVKTVESNKDGMVISEVRRGYSFNSTIIRHPMVAVGASKTDAPPAGAGNSPDGKSK